MPAAPQVTIIIPARNAEPFLAESIQSAIEQTETNLEVLVVDNLSTDRTREIACSFSDLRLRVLTCKRLGASAARNVGLAEARGKYIQFLDADDVLDSEKVERQLRVLSGHDPVCTIASGTWLGFTRRIDDASVTIERAWSVEDPLEWLICSLNGGGMMQTGAWLAHRALIKAAGPWDENLSLHDDGEFFTRVLLCARKNIFVPEAKIFYRKHPDGLSQRRGRAAIESALRVCELRDHHILGVRSDKLARSAVATQYLQFAYEFIADAPDLAHKAVGRIEELGAEPFNSVGGRNFRLLTGIAGHRLALKLRSPYARRRT